MVQQGSETAQFNLLIMQKEGRATDEDLALAFAGQGLDAAPTGAVQTGIVSANQSGTATSDVPAGSLIGVPAAAVTTNSAATAPGTKLSIEDTWLWQTPARHYVLQIFTSSNMARVEEYARRNLGAFQSQLQVAHTSNQDRDWFVLLMGPFATLDEANSTLQRLPHATQEVKPWARSVQSIHKSSGRPGSGLMLQRTRPAAIELGLTRARVKVTDRDPPSIPDHKTQESIFSLKGIRQMHGQHR